eukprot:3941701-Rhodomonas_salina.4
MMLPGRSCSRRRVPTWRRNLRNLPTRVVGDASHWGTRLRCTDAAYGATARCTDMAFGGTARCTDMAFGGTARCTDMAFGGTARCTDMASGGIARSIGSTSSSPRYCYGPATRMLCGVRGHGLAGLAGTRSRPIPTNPKPQTQNLRP